MDNLLSYCGLVDARISASEKDLPVFESFVYLFSLFTGCFCTDCLQSLCRSKNIDCLYYYLVTTQMRFGWQQIKQVLRKIYVSYSSKKVTLDIRLKMIE